MIRIDNASLAALVDGTHSQPHQILGAHPDADGVTVRALRPDATEVEVVVGEQHYPMQHEYSGVWVTELPVTDVPDYRLAVSYGGGLLPAHDPHPTPRSAASQARSISQRALSLSSGMRVSHESATTVWK